MTSISRSKLQADALDKVQLVLDKLTAQGREPDDWEREHLADALGSIFRGAYSLASALAALAAVPKGQRSPLAPCDPAYDDITLSQLKHALVDAISQPVREHPHFGPVVPL